LSRKKEKKRADQLLISTTLKPEKVGDSSRFFFKNNSDRFSVNQFDVEYMEKIFSLAKENNIEIKCFTAPDFYAQKSRFSNYAETEKILLNILNKNKINFLFNILLLFMLETEDFFESNSFFLFQW
jgi:hypothetical protein